MTTCYRTLLGFILGFIMLSFSARRTEASCGTPHEAGRWKNDDASSHGVTHIELRYVCQDQILNGEPYPPGPAWYVRVVGSCAPTDCDWGDLGATRLENGDIYATYDHGFARRFVRVRVSKTRPGKLWLWISTDFTDPGRQDYVFSGWFHGE